MSKYSKGFVDNWKGPHRLTITVYGPMKDPRVDIDSEAFGQIMYASPTAGIHGLQHGSFEADSPNYNKLMEALDEIQDAVRKINTLYHQITHDGQSE